MKKQMIVGMVLSVGLFSLDGMGQAVKSKVMTGSALNNVSTIVPQSSTSQAGNNSGVSVSSSTTSSSISSVLIGQTEQRIKVDPSIPTSSSSSSISSVLIGQTEQRIKVDPSILKGSGSEAPAPSGQSVSPESSVVEEGGSRLLYNKPRLGGQEEVVEEKKEEIVERNSSGNNSTASGPDLPSFGYNSKGELACSVLENGERLIYKTDDLSSTPCFKLAKLKKLKMPVKPYRSDIAALGDDAQFWYGENDSATPKLRGALGANNNGGSLLSNNQLPEAGATSTTSSGQAASNSNNGGDCAEKDRVKKFAGLEEVTISTCIDREIREESMANLTVKSNQNNNIRPEIQTAPAPFVGTGISGSIIKNNGLITGPSPASIAAPKVNYK